MSDFSRRKFLKTGAAALAGITIAPSSILGMSHGHVSPTDKLNLAAVGIGGMGHANINNVKGTENIVALCDVDWKYAKGVFDEFPNAKKYWDYRKMYDEMGKSIDGVIIATADHTHAIITADAMTMGKHVYCQKPLTHSVYESRLLTNLAASTGVVTQMGNQGASGEGTDLVCEWIWNGEIGEVTKVECATDRPIWPQGLNALKKADRIIRDFQPDVILGTGGYASYPMLHEGARLGIPTAVHESNAVPGLATKMVADKVDRILVSFADSRSAYRDPSRVIAVGMPVREEFVFTRRADARHALGLDEKTPMIVSAWGSLGAREMNKRIAQFMKLECEQDCWRHIHATGSFGWRWMPEYVKEQGVDLKSHPRLDMREYIYDMPQVMAAADLIICRAGAATIAEVCASATPCIMVPSPNVTDNHQEKNARVLEKNGAAVVIRENECDGDSLYEAAKQLLSDRERCRAMRSAAANLAVVDAAERIYQTALELSRH